MLQSVQTDMGPYCLLICLDPDHFRQNIGPDLDPNCLALMVFLK